MAALVEDIAAPQVEFRSPLSHRAGKFIKAVFTILILALCLAGGIFALIMNLWPSQQPDWAIALGIVALLAFIGWLVWAFDRYEPTRLIFQQNTIWIGGRFFGRTVAYDDLRLINLEEPENVIGRAEQIIIERLRGKPLAIWFNPKDAAQCFDALRALCDHAPAIAEQGIFAPENPAFADQARMVLHDAFKRKAKRAMYASIGSAALGIVIAAMLFVGGAHGRGWAAAIFLGITAIGSAAASVENRRQAQQILELDADDE